MNINIKINDIKSKIKSLDKSLDKSKPEDNTEVKNLVKEYLVQLNINQQNKPINQQNKPIQDRIIEQAVNDKDYLKHIISKINNLNDDKINNFDTTTFEELQLLNEIYKSWLVNNKIIGKDNPNQDFKEALADKKAKLEDKLNFINTMKPMAIFGAILTLSISLLCLFPIMITFPVILLLMVSVFLTLYPSIEIGRTVITDR